MGTRLKLVMKGRGASARHVEEVKDMGGDCCASHLGNLSAEHTVIGSSRTGN
jgi:hypothetical protein